MEHGRKGLHKIVLKLKELFSPIHKKLPDSNGHRSHLIRSRKTQTRCVRTREQVGPRNKAFITQQADFVQTPVTSISSGPSVFQRSCQCSAIFTDCSWICSLTRYPVQDALEKCGGSDNGGTDIRLQGWVLKLYYHKKVSSHLHALYVHKGKWVEG